MSSHGASDAGRQVFAISPRGAQTDFVDDAADGRRALQISLQGRTRQSVYVARGQLIRIILPDGESTEIAYRADGRLLTRTIPDSSNGDLCHHLHFASTLL